MSEQHEASMNFDLASAEPFLIRCEANLKLGLDVDLLMHIVEETELDMGSEAEIKVRFQGAPLAVRFQAFRDDIEAVNLHFFTPSEALADALSAEMMAFADHNDL